MWSEHEQYASQQNRAIHLDESAPSDQQPSQGHMADARQQQQQQFVPPPYYHPFWDNRMPPQPQQQQQQQQQQPGNSLSEGTPSGHLHRSVGHHPSSVTGVGQQQPSPGVSNPGLYSNYRLHHDIMSQPGVVAPPASFGGIIPQEHLVPGLSAPPGLLPPSPPPGLTSQTLFDESLPSGEVSEQHLVLLVNSLRQQGGNFLPQVTGPLFQWFNRVVESTGVVGNADALNATSETADLQPKLSSMDGGDLMPPGLSFSGTDDVVPVSASISSPILKDHSHSTGGHMSSGMFAPSASPPPPYLSPQGSLPDWLRSQDRGGRTMMGHPIMNNNNGGIVSSGSVGELGGHHPGIGVVKTNSFGSSGSYHQHQHHHHGYGAPGGGMHDERHL